jgi:hypothetical protein
MSWPRLTSKLIPTTNFKKCQLCGKESTDQYDFRLWIEHDDKDVIEKRNILIACIDKECTEQIVQHPRLYQEINICKGLPGFFLFICGDCHYRNKYNCTHPKLKMNGGEGLQVYMESFLNFKAIVCFNDGTSETITGHRVVDCEALHEGETK